MTAFSAITGRLYSPPPSSYGYGLNLMTARLASDPLFVADVTIDNAVIGSRWLMVDAGNPSRILGTGMIASSHEVIPNVPGYADPFLIELRLRNASNPPYYKPYTTIVPHTSNGSYVYAVQIPDE